MTQRKSDKYTPEVMDSLPFSEFIRVAIMDIEAVEADDQYDVCMSLWHSPVKEIDELAEDGSSTHPKTIKCGVCFAGAVMARLGRTSMEDYSISDDLDPMGLAEDLDVPSLGDKLDALDTLRGYQFNVAVATFYGRGTTVGEYEKFEDFCNGLPGYPPYDRSPDRFKDNMLAFADLLESMEL